MTNFSGTIETLAEPDAAALTHTLLIAANALTDEASACALVAATIRRAVLDAGVDNPARAGRDAALNLAIDGLSAEQQCIVAAALAFQRNNPRPHRELAYLRLTKEHQRLTLALAAALMLAEKLAGATGATLVIAAGQPPTLLLSGLTPKQLDGAAGALTSWRALAGELELRSVPPDEILSVQTGLDLIGGSSAPPLVLDVPVQIVERLTPGEPLAEGARRVLRRQFERMLAREDSVREGEDIEDVHQMRVATRRLRASLQIVEPFFDATLIRRFRRGLRAVAAALGAVRDRDVLLEDLHGRQDAALDAVIAAVAAERAEARTELLDDLEAKAYRKFKHAFAVFLTTPGADLGPLPTSGQPPRVRDAAGSLIYGRYEDLRAFEVLLPDGPDEQFHQARIAGKRLRYTLEFFSDALGERADAALAPLAELQEALGTLQDAAVAADYVRDLAHPADPGALTYIAARTADSAAARVAAIPRWRKVVSAGYRRGMLNMIGRL